MSKTKKASFAVIFLLLGILLKKFLAVEVFLTGKAEASNQEKDHRQIPKINSLTQTQKKSDLKKNQNLTEKEIYCILSKKSSVTLSGEIKIQSGLESVSKNVLHTYVFLRSSQCPDDKYSIVKINTDGEIEKEIDCQFASFETLITEGEGRYWQLMPQKFKVNEYNLAILGPSQFLVFCPAKDAFQLSRRGHFVANSLLTDDQGCFLWSDEDAPIVLTTKTDILLQNGCFKDSKQCIAQMSLKDSLIKNIVFEDPRNLRVTYEGDLKKATKSAMISGALEFIDSKHRGPTGIENWDDIEILKFPITCD